jgi:hypothetical protein
MREILETAPANTPVILVTPLTLTVRKRCYTLISLCLTHPAPRVARKEFWTARIREIPLFRYNPWDFYKPFLKLGLGLSLVLCNNGTGIRVMRTFGIISEYDRVYCFPEIQYPNFVNIYKYYLFKNKIFVFTEYIGFSIEELLFYLIYLIEREIVYIIN